MNKIDELNDLFEKFKEQLLIDVTKRDHLEKELNKKESEIHSLTEEMNIDEKVYTLLKAASKTARDNILKDIENSMTAFLRRVLNNNIRFIADYKDDGNPTVDFYVTDYNGDETFLTDPKDSRGGGLIDIICTGLRLLFYSILKNKDDFNLDGPFVLDEPAKYLSNEYIPDFVDILKTFSKSENKQIIVVTHNQFLSNSADNIFRVRLEDGVSKVESELIDKIG